MSYFNCIGVNWGKMEERRIVESWSDDMIQLPMENAIDQRLEEFTRHRGEKELPMLDLRK